MRSIRTTNKKQLENENKVFFIMGVSGSGKTTIAQLVAEALQVPFYDADDFHSDANRHKMAAGIPLNDEDRYGWLVSINEFSKQQLPNSSIVFACSALKETYRAILMEGIKPTSVWFYLDGSYDLILTRLRKRKGHFMPTSLLQSQFDTLEIPTYATKIDISLPIDTNVNDVIEAVKAAERSTVQQ